jgi:hypothetical protein
LPPLNWDPAKAYDPARKNFINTAGLAVPYLRDPNGVAGDGDEELITGESVQIVACGLDNKFGVGPAAGKPSKLFPSGAGWDPSGGDDDNVTNFCDKARLVDAK